MEKRDCEQAAPTGQTQDTNENTASCAYTPPYTNATPSKGGIAGADSSIPSCACSSQSLADNADSHAELPQRFGDPTRPEELVRIFHRTYGLPIVDDGPNADRERIHMRLSLIAEEFAELVGAAYGQAARQHIETAFQQARASDDNTRDTVEIADALGDLIYVIYGMALELGIPMAKVLDEIQGSNMSKLDSDGKPIYRADGKVLKGPNFYPPNIARVLGY
ncbi:hypothetical protein [Trueperella sp. LYQ143]|uniref:hypothetical protein n=1 Tax=Trueperella sp. LYQ143 TaxID=3391059 RepID=UPI003982EB35